MRFGVGLFVMLMVTPVLAATPVKQTVVMQPISVQTLAARLALETLPELQIVSSSADATRADYTLRSRGGVRSVVSTVQRYLLAEGWNSHPNVPQAPSPAPKPGEQRATFVQGDELLELRAAQADQNNLVALHLVLLSAKPPPRFAGAP